ncbi:MAG: class I SAM-dependent methyltransferase [archaeon]|nr:class I SAM-dependent methyltransferase [archaeon]MCP8316379.1 class I SAM-dependent methyltransferase [archaeon]MCP8320672.1 class I SAM-dependent methyltransferase [archaeon]
MTENFGLREQWHKVIDALHAIMPVYDRVNHIISFGRDRAYREEGIANALPSAELVLDAGCGPGVMSEIASKKLKIKDLILLDPMLDYLTIARKRLADNNPEMVVGLFEALPFKRGIFDLVMCGFSLRDSVNMNLAVKEISRVLKNDGEFIIVDLGKPDNPVKRYIIGIWWRFIVPLMTTVLVKRKGLFYTAIYTTYKRLPRNRELKNIVRIWFSEVILRVKMLGGIVIVTAKKSMHN